MFPSSQCVAFIKSYEGLKLHAYKCSAGVWTIGYGTILYPIGVKVRAGDVITIAQAMEYLAHEVKLKAFAVSKVTSDRTINQNQYDALVSFAYNVGAGALADSTLLKKLRINPADPNMRKEFMRWNKARNPKTGKLEPVDGLTNRRRAEADLYFKRP